MKLKKLYIKNYKNLKDLSLDFSKGEGLSLLVGNNGSGKSNILEAISGIFAESYSSVKKIFLDCDYKLEYEIEGKVILIEKKQNECFVFCDKQKVLMNEALQYLPHKVLAIYSGDDDRLWSTFYQYFYKRYSRSINSHKPLQLQELYFINKYYWNIALLTMIVYRNEDISDFLEKQIGIKNIKEVIIGFNLINISNTKNPLLLAFLNRINPTNESSISISVEEIKNRLSEINAGEFFNFFVQAFMPKEKKQVNNIEVVFNQDITLSDLSEGEKKLILIKATLEYVADEETFVLLDEPDANIHEARKQDLYNLLSTYTEYGRQVIITTHSPIFIELADDEKIIMLKSNSSGFVEQFNTDDVEKIRYLTGQRINAFYEKTILFCEGTESGNEALLYPVLFPQYKVIPCGGHDEVINRTKTYNKCFSKLKNKAIGIIDGDFLVEKQKDVLQRESIFSLNVLESENILMDEIILAKACERFCTDDETLDDVKNKVFDLCKKKKTEQSLKYTKAHIVNNIKTNLQEKGKSIDEFKKQVEDVCDQEKIDKVYNDQLNSLTNFIEQKNYCKLCEIYDFNHAISKYTESIIKEPNFQNRLIKLISKDRELQKKIIEKYFPNIPL